MFLQIRPLPPGQLISSHTSNNFCSTESDVHDSGVSYWSLTDLGFFSYSAAKRTNFSCQ